MFNDTFYHFLCSALSSASARDAAAASLSWCEDSNAASSSAKAAHLSYARRPIFAMRMLLQPLTTVSCLSLSPTSSSSSLLRGAARFVFWRRVFDNALLKNTHQPPIAYLVLFEVSRMACEPAGWKAWPHGGSSPPFSSGEVPRTAFAPAASGSASAVASAQFCSVAYGIPGMSLNDVVHWWRAFWERHGLTLCRALKKAPDTH